MFANPIGPVRARRGMLGAVPSSGCIGFLHVGGTYMRQSDGSYTLRADTPDATSAGNNAGYGAGELFYLPDGFGSHNPPGTSGRIVLNGTLWTGNRIFNVQGWGTNPVGPEPPQLTEGQSCPAGTWAGGAPAAPIAPAAPAPAAPAPAAPAPAAPTTTTTTAPTTTTTTAPTTTTTTAPAAGEVPSYGPSGGEDRRAELDGEEETTTTPAGPSLPVNIVLAGAALFAVILAWDRRR